MGHLMIIALITESKDDEHRAFDHKPIIIFIIRDINKNSYHLLSTYYVIDALCTFNPNFTHDIDIPIL